MRAFAALLALFFAIGAPQALADSASDTIAKARHGYYSLDAKGFTSFQCTVLPDWKALMADLAKTNPQGAAHAVELLSQIHFTVSLQRGKDAKVTHSTLSGQDKQMNEALQQIYGGMEEMLTGFFPTWTLFTLGTPLPDPAGKFQLSDNEGQWRVSFKDGTSDVTTEMGKDLVIRAVQVKANDFYSVIYPAFNASPEGLLLSGYKSSYRSGKPDESTDLDISFSYQQVNEIQLPRRLLLAGRYGPDPFKITLSLANCQATRK